LDPTDSSQDGSASQIRTVDILFVGEAL
jgi:hypothetical protein